MSIPASASAGANTHTQNHHVPLQNANKVSMNWRLWDHFAITFFPHLPIGKSSCQSFFSHSIPTTTEQPLNNTATQQPKSRRARHTMILLLLLLSSFWKRGYYYPPVLVAWLGCALPSHAFSILNHVAKHSVSMTTTTFQSRPLPLLSSSSSSSLAASPQAYLQENCTFVDKIQLNKPPTNKLQQQQHVLDLDTSAGTLRLDGGTALLNGLTSSLWSASRPSSTITSDETATTSYDDDDVDNSVHNAIFLHTRYPQECAQHEAQLGELLSCQRLLACARISRYWMGPKVGSRAQDIPWDTQFLLIEVQDGGPYALVLPLVDNGFRASLTYAEDPRGGSIQVVCLAESGDASVKSKGMRALYVAVGDDPFELVKHGFRHVADATQTFETLDRKKIPPSVDDFGWCTWDAFYSKVTPEGVLQGVEALTKAGVPPRNVILDDGWQQVNPAPPEWQSSSSPSIATKADVPETDEEDGDEKSSLLVSFVTGLYGRYVQRAAHGSWGNRIWRAMTKTSFLKKRLWDFFDQNTDFNRQLNGFPANSKFEDDEHSLRGLVAALKGKYNVKTVLCWHALHGYWRGVSEELGRDVGLNVTNLIPQPSRSLLRLEPQLAWDPVSLWGVGLLSNEQDLAKFYEYLHAPLVEAGVDGVKVDVQSGVSAAGGSVGGGPHLAKLYTNAMEESVSKRFVAENGAANCINCMCHSTENLYRYKTTAVARASDDFFPQIPESHTVHLINVAYNSLFLGEICLPDWDMFHSLHPSAGLHAAARAVGGCPVYVSDAPGKHDADLLRKLVMPDGSVLRAQLPGRPTRDCLFVDVGSDGTSALKIWNQNACGGVLGAFHVQGVAWNFDSHENEVVENKPPPLVAAVRPHDVETLRDHDGPFAAWRHQSGTLEFLPSGDSTMKAPLQHRDWEIFTIVPLHIHNDIMWGPVGLVDMLNSGGAIIDSGGLHNVVSATTTATEFTCRGPGRLVAFTNRQPADILLNGTTKLEFIYDAANCQLSIVVPSEAAGSNEPLHHISVTWET